ncbi:FAD/NAD(P)-binding protein [Glarea lozoyensis ATCC 20868]|uniref:FAD/NAD(P)-binding protein n=1 Tax=Glarea lozoyensis (strain ATCC 20868 / MF5171) TaxID=1116229 RepID=S3DDK4_GLAL2|nr:FAD/NAD(P)-binding protein [Glarea lozoyensis ATCC 20868]EPE35189.1 FAD/NAD(P)-binding protein [Glarea lozoyensis ATCC 20868]
MWPFNLFQRAYPEIPHEDVHGREYDYIIIGGGTAGAVLTSLLSASPTTTVLLLERGPALDTWASRIPIASSNILRSDGGASSWLCDPMKHCDNRQSLFFRGEVLGGASRINSMVYSRGSKADYDAWAAMGLPEWSYEKVLPFFVKGERNLNQPKTHFRGTTGPWITRTFTYFTWLYNVYQVFADVAVTLGFPLIPDATDPEASPEGLATFDVTMNENSERVSTFDAFIPRSIALARENNLTICTKAIVSKIKWSKEDGELRAKSVVFTTTDRKSGKVFVAKVKKEVIICAGAIGTPQVLMLSGIGPAEHLEELGIEVMKDLPGVGSELTDHPAIPIAWEIPIKESLTKLVVSPILEGGKEFLKYILWGTGLLAFPIQPISLFVRSTSLTKNGTELRDDISHDVDKLSEPQTQIPDIELMPLATSAMDNLEEHYKLFSKIGVFSILATLLQPKSRGTVRLASSNHHDHPKVDFGLLSDPKDYIIARTAIRLSLAIGGRMTAAGFPLLRNLTYPEEKQDLDRKNGNTEEMDKLIRGRIRTTYHYACSCRMAAEDDARAPGVVSETLRVYGTLNVRIADTSVLPQIVATHLQAPAVMVAERCADFILKSA